MVLLVVALRCYARLFIVERFGLDDWLALSTLIPYIAFMSLCIVLIHLGSGRHLAYIQYILENATINTTEVLDFCAHITYTTALLTCRLSGLAFYARITEGSQRLIWTIRAAAGFMIMAYLPQVFLIIFHCLPITGFWPYSFQPEVNNYTCLQWGEVYVTNSVISLLCDMVLLAIPVPLITRLKVDSATKIRLFLVLMPGLLVVAISRTRMYLVIVGQWEADESWSYDPLLAVEVSEIGSTLVALSVPALKPFFGSLFASLDRTSVSSAYYFRSRSGDRGNRARDDGLGIELDNRYGCAPKFGLAAGAKTEHGPVSTPMGVIPETVEDDAAGYRPEELLYSATIHAHDGRDPSIGSDISQQPMIRYARDFTVSHEVINAAMHAR
ncbi:hypothetical protein B0A55_10622 [Friedmanniomyces simplex]|uniref:Rhodopsin domain-containing protein n=1 Tax=Friedmanniomyces simplex TaxID=329884 RepID=A0A4U0WWN5_9PEZI|nr:hypothetical protein B0A55_10622 [Friedmanniomyces simplex]